MDGEGLLSLFGFIMCIIAYGISLFNDDSSKLECSLCLFVAVVFFLNAWVHSSQELLDEVRWLVRSFR